ARGVQRSCLSSGSQTVVWSVAHSPDGRLIASGLGNGTIRVWNAHDGVELRCLHGHDGWVYCLSFSPDGKQLASGAYDHTVRVWDVSSDEDFLCRRGDKEEFLTRVALAPCGRKLVSHTLERTVYVWDVASGIQLFSL